MKPRSTTKKTAKDLPVEVHQGDARRLPLAASSVDVIITSPPYWRKRDYSHPDQIGQEDTVKAYVKSMRRVMREWWRVLRPTGSVFVNIGDTYQDNSLVGVPGFLEEAARKQGWCLRNRIIWAKDGGLPSAAKNRLVNRHEFILHLTKSASDYYYDLLGYCRAKGCIGKPGDVWELPRSRHKGKHPAPFHPELVKRAILLACPKKTCSACGAPRRRLMERTLQLNPKRVQARRAMEIAKEAKLTPAHFAAIQATGISDAGKGKTFQTGAGRNSAEVKRLAEEAKRILGGYFREFTFPLWKSGGWERCACKAKLTPGVVLDCFAGTNTTLQVAAALKRKGIGVDLSPQPFTASGKTLTRGGPASRPRAKKLPTKLSRPPSAGKIEKITSLKQLEAAARLAA